MFPEHDTQFEDTIITAVQPVANGWSITRADGWSFHVPASAPVPPQVGTPIRFYGAGLGSPVRGLFLDGTCIYYRTEADDRAYQREQMYGRDAVEWLQRWDAGRPVWSIAMGGLGPGYEQAIQITVAEILRHLLTEGYETTRWHVPDIWQQTRERIKQANFDNPTITAMGLSGAQYGAALNLAIHLYRRGPQHVMTDEQVQNRHIQVSKHFPSVPDEEDC